MTPSVESSVPRRARYDLSELARLGGVTPRTVRYYLTEGLIPPPLGRGRGKHYDEAHLVRLLAVRWFRDQGVPVRELRERLTSHYAHEALEHGLSPPASAGLEEAERTLRPTARQLEMLALAPAFRPDAPDPARSSWTRIELAPGLELEVSSHRELPAAARLALLAAWCRLEFGAPGDE